MTLVHTDHMLETKTFQPLFGSDILRIYEPSCIYTHVYMHVSTGKVQIP